MIEDAFFSMAAHTYLLSTFICFTSLLQHACRSLQTIECFHSSLIKQNKHLLQDHVKFNAMWNGMQKCTKLHMEVQVPAAISGQDRIFFAREGLHKECFLLPFLLGMELSPKMFRTS